MAKTVLSVKVEPDIAETIKKKAKQSGKSVSDLMQEGLFNTTKINVLETKLQKIERVNNELLKLIQEYARISLLNFIIFNKDKRELIKLLDLAQIDDASLKKLKHQITKIKKLIGPQPKFELFNHSKYLGPL